MQYPSQQLPISQKQPMLQVAFPLLVDNHCWRKDKKQQLINCHNNLREKQLHTDTSSFVRGKYKTEQKTEQKKQRVEVRSARKDGLQEERNETDKQNPKKSVFI